MLNVEAQIRYLVQWFNEWSELQRSDFLPVMVEKYTNKVHMNGIVDNMANINCQDKPMSLFQCRVKLFKEWIVQWNQENRDNFLKQIAEIDPEFGEKLTAELQNGVPQMNGVHDTNGEDILAD